MTGQPTRNRLVDVAAIRRDYPIEDVMAAAGIELRPAGHGFVGHCPFHVDTTPSMSVAGIPDRFTCFGCGAHGDVIDFVQRLHHVTFIEAVHTLTADSPLRTASGLTARRQEVPGRPASTYAEVTGVPDVTAERGFAINALAWRHLSVPVRASFAEQYLLHHRGIDLRPLHAELRAERVAAHPDQLLVGYAGHGWTTLVDALRRDGVTADELTVMDLGQRTRDDRLIDTLRDRIVVPVLDAEHRIRGFIGRDISGNPRAPKYRNPTHTPTFDKSRILYRPTHHVLEPGGTAVIVEGVLDALAIAAAAAVAGRSHRFAPCAANGITVSAAQVGHILGLAREAHCVLALDGDQAGRDGTARWLHELTIRHGKPAFVTALPPGADPAMWLQHHHPDDGLGNFAHPGYRSTAAAAPYLPARELTRLAGITDGVGNTTAGDIGSQQRIANVCRHLTPLLHRLPPGLARWLLEESQSEMTRLGWDAGGVYSAALHRHPDARALLETPLLVEGPALSLSKSLVPRPGVEL